MNFNREKFLSFYRNEPEIYSRANILWDSIFNALKTDSVCPTCNQHTDTVSPLVMLYILATIRIENGRDFLPKRENLNYSAQGLLTIFPKYFSPAQAQQFAFKPELIANRVYANRMGNGDESSGEGWKYRGANFLQFTGKDNWNTYGLNEQNCLDIQKGAEATVKYFRDRKIIEDCLRQDPTTVRRKVNGGSIGLKEFINVINTYNK